MGGSGVSKMIDAKGGDEPLSDTKRADLKFSWLEDDEAPEFCESGGAKLRRWALAAAYTVQPSRLHLLPPLLVKSISYALNRLARSARLPDDPRPVGPEGLVSVCGDLPVATMLEVYRRGLIPVAHAGPLKLWSPSVRAVLFLEDAHVETKVRKLMRKKIHRITFDQDFAAVMRACAQPRPGKTPLTWITPRMMQAFWQLHQLGYAHSVEVWNENGQLVGGVYGLALGRIFFGESQFSFGRDASKIASAALNQRLLERGFVLRDAKWMTPHHAKAGFKIISREEFHRLLRTYAYSPEERVDWSASF